MRKLLPLGRVATNLLLKTQGDGDLGATVTTAEETVLHRSEKPQARRFRSIYGSHNFSAFVDSRGPKEKIELRPIDACINLPW